MFNSQYTDNSLSSMFNNSQAALTNSNLTSTAGNMSLCGNYSYWPYDYTVPYSYPVYSSYPVYIDKSDKALKILKALMDEKIIQVTSVPKFITLLDRIKKEL